MSPFNLPELTPTSRPLGGIIAVRLAINGMKHKIETHLADHGQVISETIRRELQAACDNFDIAAEVQKVAAQVIQQQIKYAVERAVREAFDSVEFRGVLTAAVTKAIHDTTE